MTLQGSKFRNVECVEPPNSGVDAKLGCSSPPWQGDSNFRVYLGIIGRPEREPSRVIPPFSPFRNASHALFTSIMVAWDDIPVQLHYSWLALEQGLLNVNVLWRISDVPRFDHTFYIHLIKSGADDRILTERTELPRDLNGHVVRTSSWTPNSFAMTAAQVRLLSAKITPGTYQVCLLHTCIELFGN
jgi:hypothetical protein